MNFATTPIHLSPLYSALRYKHYAVIELLKPHMTLSTSHINGGVQTGVRYLVNHQSCEGVKHTQQAEQLHALSQQAYAKTVCDQLELPHTATTVMGTAANMNYMGQTTLSTPSLTVHALVTAGVKGNAGKAGDPARWDESDGHWVPDHAVPGTINTILLIESPITEAALTRAASTLTEAKSAALQELAIGSRYSSGLATGTGTDQFTIAALNSNPQDSSIKPRTWSGQHTKLGELIGCTVKKATLEALRWQNGLEPSLTRNLFHALDRFGLDENRLKTLLDTFAPKETCELLLNNFTAVTHDPHIAGSAYAIAAVMDRIQYGTLSNELAQELLLNQCALMAVGQARDYAAFADIRNELTSTTDLCELVAKSLSLGIELKWRHSITR